MQFLESLLWNLPLTDWLQHSYVISSGKNKWNLHKFHENIFSCLLLAYRIVLTIEILPMTDYQQRGETFSVLGSKYDLFEGIYGPADWKRLCQFLELDRTPICCAIPKNHPLCDHKQISMHDLDNQHIVTIPLDTDLTLPYGLMYANEPSEALKKFLRIVKKLTW